MREFLVGICMYACVYMYVHLRCSSWRLNSEAGASVGLCACISWLYVYVRVSVYDCPAVFVCVCLFVCLLFYVHVCVCMPGEEMFTCKYIHQYIHTYIHTYRI